MDLYHTSALTLPIEGVKSLKDQRRKLRLRYNQSVGQALVLLVRFV